MDVRTGQSGAVSLHGIEAGEPCRRRESQVGCAERTEVIDAAVVDGEDSFQRNKIEIGAELRVMCADVPGKVVGELVALFGTLNV